MIFALLIISACAMTAQEQRECIINEARAQFGKPYVLATEGPDTFDCSGLVQWCYEHCGYYFDHRVVTGTLIDMGHSVSESNLILADLVFPHSGHVQLYSGNGNIIHAPHSGEVVKEQAMYNWYAGRRLITGDSSSGGGSSGGSGRATVTASSLNVRVEPSSSSESVAKYYEGESVPYDGFVTNSECTWLTYIANSGNRRYVCGKTASGTCYVSPCP